MPKILLAIYDDISRRAYKELFLEEKFEVLETKNGTQAIELAIKEKPDLVLADVTLLGSSGFAVLRTLQDNDQTKKIPVLIFSQIGREEEVREAMDLGAKDFIVGAITSPRDLAAKIKIHLGLQKTYRLIIDEKSTEIAQELRKDMGYLPEYQCPRCGFLMHLFLMRDLSKGKDYFKVSFTCPNCDYTE